MPNQCAATNLSPIIRLLPEAPPQDRIDPVMRMNMDDSELIARLQRLTTELLIEKRLGQRRPELTRELYQTWLEVGQRGLKETPEYRNVMLRGRSACFVAASIRSVRDIWRTSTTHSPISFQYVVEKAFDPLDSGFSRLLGWRADPKYQLQLACTVWLWAMASNDAAINRPCSSD